MTSAGEQQRDADRALAAEYALRLVPAAEIRAVQLRLKAEPELRAFVREWTDVLGALNQEIEEVAPPAQIKEAILNRIGPTPSERAMLSGMRLLAGLGIGGAAGIVALAGFLLIAPPSIQHGPQATYAADLTGADATLTLSVEFSIRRNGIVLRDLRGAPDFGTVYELWLIEEGQDPISLGVLPGTVETWFAVDPDLQAKFPGATLAVTEEPPGGAPNGIATGPVRASGIVTQL